MERIESYCPHCLKKTVFDVEAVPCHDPVLGVSVKSTRHICVCEECGEEILIPKFEDMDERSSFEAYKKKMGLMSGPSIKKLRERYGLSSSSFASLLGLGEKTLVRYENGDIQTKEIDTLLHLMENEEIFIYLYRRKIDVLSPLQRSRVEKALGPSLSRKPLLA